MSLKYQVLSAMDKRGIIGQPDYPKQHNGGIDGGDSINRMGHYHFLIEANKKIGNNIGERENLPSRTYVEYEVQLNEFECPKSKGNYRRHPEVTKFGIAYYCNGTYDGVMSRDQSIPLVISLIVMGMYKRLGMYFLRHLMRGLLFTTNTRINALSLKTKKLPDFTGPEFWALYIRSNPITGILLYPLLCLFDLETLLGSIVRRNQKLIDGKKINDDVINHLTVCIFGAMNYPTPVMWLANKVNNYNDLLEKLKYYCGADERNLWRKIPFFVDLYEPLMARYMK
jgi:hypothetical protein